MAEKLLEVTVLSPEDMIFQGKAQRVVLPGEQGVFEILPFHKRLLSRLLSGVVVIDQQQIPIYRGVVRVGDNKITIIIEAQRSKV